MEKEGRWDDGRPGRFRLDKSKPLLINKGLLACRGHVRKQEHSKFSS